MFLGGNREFLFFIQSTSLSLLIGGLKSLIYRVIFERCSLMPAYLLNFIVFVCFIFLFLSCLVLFYLGLFFLVDACVTLFISSSYFSSMLCKVGLISINSFRLFLSRKVFYLFFSIITYSFSGLSIPGWQYFIFQNVLYIFLSPLAF